MVIQKRVGDFEMMDIRNCDNMLLMKEFKDNPTQKPVSLYRWLLSTYAKENDLILDTHLGSGSIAIAAHELGYNLTACERSKKHFDDAMKRIKNHTDQNKLAFPAA